MWTRLRRSRPASANPEGLTVDANGNLYATTFAPTAPAGPARTSLCLSTPHGPIAAPAKH